MNWCTRTTVLSLLLVVLGLPVSQSFADGSDCSGLQGPAADRAQQLGEAARLNQEVKKLYQEKRFNDALPLAQRVVSIRRSILARDDAEIADALANVGEIQLARAKLKEAQNAFQESLTIYQLHSDANASSVVRMLERLGYLSYMTFDNEKAQSLYQQAIDLRKRNGVGDQLALARALINLANIVQFRGNHTRAETIYVEGLSMLESDLGRTHPETVQAMKDYACSGLKGRGPVPSKNQEEEKPGDVIKAFRDRASCWLYGFNDNCADVSGISPGTYTNTVNGKAVKLGVPTYPRAGMMAIPGRVFVAVRIDEEGKVIKTNEVCAPKTIFSSPAIDAAKASRFTPTLLDGTPVQVNGVIVYNFVSRR